MQQGLEQKLYSPSGLNLSLYREFRQKDRLPKRLAQSLVRVERSSRDKAKRSKVVAAGVAFGAFPRRIQEVAGKSLGISEQDLYQLTVFKSIPEPTELIFYGSVISAKVAGVDLPEEAYWTLATLALDKVVYTTLPFITKKPHLRPLSLITNPVVALTTSYFAVRKVVDLSKKVGEWYANSPDKLIIDRLRQRVATGSLYAAVEGYALRDSLADGFREVVSKVIK